MSLFNAFVFGGFVALLVDYWLKRFRVQDNGRLIISVIVGVVVGVLVFLGEIAYF